jgi:predicted transcriptional regulator
LRRRKNLHESGDYQKQIYQNKDIYRLKILIFLSTTRDGSYKNEMFQRTDLTHWNNFEVLDDLIKLEWIKQDHAYGKDIFKITDTGRKVTNHVKEILMNESPLKDLDIFKGISISNFT